MGYCWESADGGVSDWPAIDNLQDAQQAVEVVLSSQGIDAPVWAEQADADGINDDGKQCWRLLAWASDEDAAGDSGAKAIGQLNWICDEY